MSDELIYVYHPVKREFRACCRSREDAIAMIDKTLRVNLDLAFALGCETFEVWVKGESQPRLSCCPKEAIEYDANL